ncbi:helix-turn-helix transcriptional regulator [Marivita sp.]|uniref:helix-turn-helix transcriptional regulator n=1 Tax=Marivita sp. TaxID=2003365 RepID=UPI003B59BE09
MRKILDVLRLAEAAAARENGINLDDIQQLLKLRTRTAQRLVHLFEEAFPTVMKRKDADRTRWWKLHDEPLIRYQGIREKELASLETAILRARQHGAPLEVHHLESIRDRMLASMTPMEARAIKHNAKAVLEARGHAYRPGPRARLNPDVLAAIEDALETSMQLLVSYQGKEDAVATDRTLDPYGLLFGIREYLIARDPEKDNRLRSFRLDRIAAIAVTDHPFQKDPEVDLQAHAAKAFGSYYSEEEYGPVAWRFSPEAAKVAREFEFHPDQRIEDTDDGGMIVRFSASGWLEMAWHLYKWGDGVTVLEPAGLAKVVAEHRRGDFPSLP